MRQVKTWTAKEVAAIKTPGVTAIGGVPGLYLKFDDGRRCYLLRYLSPVTGKRTMVSLGSYDSQTLAEARGKAAELVAKIAHGIDPADERRQEKRRRKAEQLKEAQRGRDKRFRTVALQWLDFRVQAGYYDQNVRGASVVRSYLERDIFPRLGSLPIEEISARDVFNCVRPLWTTTTEAKNKVLAIISNVFRWAGAMEIAEVGNPADRRGPLGVLLENLAPRSPVPRNHGALPPERIPEFFAALIERKTMAARALAFALLTASRSKPARTAKWSEIDLEHRTWTCPEEVMKVKGRGAFVVMLSTAAVELLKAQPVYPGVDLVFPSPSRFGVITDAGIGQVIGDMHKEAVQRGEPGWLDEAQTELYGEPVRATVHGTCRASFKTWTRSDENLKRFHADAVEMCLAHQVDDGYSGAYDRATLEEERRRVMEAWGEYCAQKVKEFCW